MSSSNNCHGSVSQYLWKLHIIPYEWKTLRKLDLYADEAAFSPRSHLESSCFSSCFFTCFPQNYPACQLQSAFNFPGVSLTDQLHAPQQHRITYHGCTGSLGTAWMVKWQLLPDTSVKRVFGCLGWRKNAYARPLNVTLLIISMFSPLEKAT